MLSPENVPSFTVTVQKAGINLLAGGHAFTNEWQVRMWAASRLDCEPDEVEVNIVEADPAESREWRRLYEENGVAGV